MFPEQIVRKACVVAFNLGYKDFCKLFNMDERFGTEKFRMMQHDFSRWFCGLDGGNAHKFMGYVMKQED